MWKVLIACCAALLTLPASAQRAGDDERLAMVREIVDMTTRHGAGTGRPSIAPVVLDAIGRVPRHEFVPASLRGHAYANRPLPIGHGQTISQPYIVAVMTDLLGVGTGASVLEVGTGSGYQAAVLADLGVRVFSIEIVEPLAVEATARLRRLGYTNVKTQVGDGYHGMPDAAPFDAIIVTAAAGHVPPPLVRQLKTGGRMVVPVGSPFQPQQLTLVEKRSDGTVTTRQLMTVSFVPLTGERR